jgi:hypothetical protein
MALIDQFNLASNTLFKSRVQEALAAAAASIYSEAQATAGHGKRGQLATSVLGNPITYVAAFAGYIATDATVAGLAGTVTVATSDVQQALVTDAAINNAVAAIWNAMAGV